MNFVEQPTDSQPFTIGTSAPRHVRTPKSVEELASQLRTTRDQGEAAVFFGGGTLQGIGNPPTRYDTAISLTALAAVITYEPTDFTIAVQAGMTLAAFERTLAKHGQFVPLDAPRLTRGTVGGALASGWAGPRRATYGRARDFVIGTTVVLADGTIASAGGMVVKNVTGYDLSKVYIGSLGTLGALVRVNFKTLPRPPAQRIALAALPEHSRERAIKHVNTLDIEPTAALLIDGFNREIEESDGIDGRLLLFFEGSSALIERATRDARSQLGAAGVPGTRVIDRGASEVLQRAIDACVTPLEQRSVTYRSTGERTLLAEHLDIFSQTTRNAALHLETIGDLCTGDVIARVSAATADHLRAAIVPFEQAIVARLQRLMILHAPDNLRMQLDAWGRSPAGTAQMRAIKARFDPTGTLAPGRLIGGI